MLLVEKVVNESSFKLNSLTEWPDSFIITEDPSGFKLNPLIVMSTNFTDLYEHYYE